MTRYLAFTLPFLFSTLVACGDKAIDDDTGSADVDDTGTDGGDDGGGDDGGDDDTGDEELQGCSMDAMAGTWTGDLDGDETIPQSITLSGSGEVDEVIGENLLDGSYYGEGYGCAFDVICQGDLDEEGTVSVWNEITVDYPAGSCIAGEYHLSLESEDVLNIVYLDEKVVQAEWTLTR